MAVARDIPLKGFESGNEIKVMSIEQTVLIGCGIFREEVEHLSQTRGLHLNVEWLPVGLHDNIERLEAALEEAIAEQKQRGRRNIGLLFGQGCLPLMKQFAQEHGVAVLSVKNCLAALVGDEELKTLEQNRTLVASPGWVRKMWLGRAGTADGWTADDYRIQFGRYDLILVLDPGIEPLSDDEIITCFDLIQVPIETRACGLEHFFKVFGRLADDLERLPA